MGKRHQNVQHEHAFDGLQLDLSYSWLQSCLLSSVSLQLFCTVRWKASNYSQLYGMTLDEGIRYRLGTQRPSRTIMNMNEIQVQNSPHTVHKHQ